MKKQRGTTLVLTALMLTALLGAAALAVDQGVMYLARERAQDCVDAAALAGGQLLPNTALATAAVQQVIAANNALGGQFSLMGLTSPRVVTRDDGATVTVGAGDSLLVSGTTDAPVAFGPAVGFAPKSDSSASNMLSIPAQATVIIQNACAIPAGAGLAPFGVIGDNPNSSDPTERYVAALLSGAASVATPQPRTYESANTFDGQPLVLRLNVWDSQGKLVTPGNMDALQFGAANQYYNNISQLSNAPLTAGQALNIQTNAMVTYTQTSLGVRLAPSNTAFTHDYKSSPAYQDWFFGDPNQSIDPALPPVTDSVTGKIYYYYQDPNRQNAGDAHLLIVPIIQQSSPNSDGTVTIMAFATFFVEQPYNAYTQPSTNAIALGRFVGLTVAGASSGGCAEAGVDTPPQLVR